jgi:hypothetical protein
MNRNQNQNLGPKDLLKDKTHNLLAEAKQTNVNTSEQTSPTDTTDKNVVGRQTQSAPAVNAEASTTLQEAHSPVNVVQDQNTQNLARESVSSKGIFEGTKISEKLEKALDYYRDNEAAISVARDAIKYVNKYKAGVPQTEESCTSGCRMLLSLIDSIYKDAQNFNQKYSVLVAVAREYDDVCFSLELINRGVAGLSEQEYSKHTQASLLLVETAHLANPKSAKGRVDITKMMSVFKNADITNRVLAWYE